MLLSRDEFIATLFRETDRAQRIKTPLALILCEIDGLARPESPYGPRTIDAVMPDIAVGILRLLRCYDSLGRISERVLGVVLPGCNSFNAVLLAQRLRIDVFGSPAAVNGDNVRLTACFGVAGSGGRSSLVVFRNAAQALNSAKGKGAGSIERCAYDTEPDALSFLMPMISGEPPNW